MKRTFIIAMLLLSLSSGILAAEFGAGAKGNGMGFSYFILADDATGALYNPSSIGYIKGWQTQLVYDKQDNYAYKPANENPYLGLLGAVYNRPNLGTFAFNGIQSGSLTSNTGISTVNRGVLSFGRELSNGISVGISAKYYMETMFAERKAFDGDLGVSWRSPLGFAASATAENLLHAKLTPAYLGIEEKLPRRERIGAAYMLAKPTWQGALAVATQLEQSGIAQEQTTTLMNIGTEWWFLTQNSFSIGARGGYTVGKALLNDAKEDYTGINLGISFNFRVGIKDLRVDYAYHAYPFNTSDGSTPMNHTIGMSFGWGGVPEYPHKDTDEQFAEPRKVEVQLKQPGQPEIYTPPPGSDIRPPEIKKNAEPSGPAFRKFDVMLDVSDLSGIDLRRIVFYIRPQQIIKTNSWKLYIFKEKIKQWSETEANTWALKVIEGKGVPPINVIWDGKLQDDRLLPKGKYYYILTAVDEKGINYATEWQKFSLE